MADLGDSWIMHLHQRFGEKWLQGTNEGDKLSYFINSKVYFFTHFNIFEVRMVASSVFGGFFFLP